MKLVDNKTGQLVDVPDEQAAGAFESGGYGLVKGQPVRIVTQDGTVGTVPAEQAHAAFADGARIAGAQEFRKAELGEKYGGIGGTAASLGEGAIRGLTLGASDPLAVGTAHLFGGEKLAGKVREHLSGEKEAHPWLSGGAELGGAALPTLLSGGVGGVAEGAGLAARGGAAALGAMSDVEAVSGIAGGIRTLGAIPRGVVGLGGMAEDALGLSGATTMLGRAGQSAAKAAVRGVVEGGLFGAGQQVSESTLQNTPLVSEQVFSNIGHSAMLGGLLGAGIGGLGKLAGEGAGAVLGKAAPKLDREAGEQTWKWLDPLKKYSEEAASRAGGTDAVGRTVFEEVLRPAVEEGGLSAAHMGQEEKLAAVEKALDLKGKEIGALIEGNAGANVKLSEMLAPIDKRIEEFSGRVGGEDKVASLQKLRDSVVKVLHPEAETLAAGVAGGARRTSEEMGQFLKANPKIMSDAPGGVVPAKYWIKGSEATPLQQAVDKDVSISDAIKQRRSLQQIAFEETKALDPKLRVQLLRDVTREWGDLEEQALNRASEGAGKLAGDHLRELNKTYQQLKIASDALETNVSRYATNRNFSLSDTLTGIAHAPWLALTGHPVAALGAVGASVVHRGLREHGNAYAAIALDRLASWGGVSQAVRESNDAIDASVNKFLSQRGPRARAFTVSRGEDVTSEKKYREEDSKVRQLMAMSPALIAAHVESRLSPLKTTAPQISQGVAALTMQASKFLASKLPPDPNAGSASLTPQLEKKSPPLEQRVRYLRYAQAVEGGPPGIFHRMSEGKLTAEDIETMHALFPSHLDDFKQRVQSACADRERPLSMLQKQEIHRLTGITTDATQLPQFASMVQASYLPTSAPPQQQVARRGGKGRHGSPPSELSVVKAAVSPVEHAMGAGRQ